MDADDGRTDTCNCAIYTIQGVPERLFLLCSKFAYYVDDQWSVLLITAN
jgi:hypothetical protein